MSKSSQVIVSEKSLIQSVVYIICEFKYIAPKTHINKFTPELLIEVLKNHFNKVNENSNRASHVKTIAIAGSQKDHSPKAHADHLELTTNVDTNTTVATINRQRIIIENEYQNVTHLFTLRLSKAS